MVDKIQYAGAEPSVLAMTKQEFFALAEGRRRKGAGSGFTEWGQQPSAPSGGLVFEGLHCTVGTANVISMGRDFTDAVGISRTITAQAVLDGIQSNLFGVSSPNGQSNIYFPDAPDGTKTYDSVTGTVVQHVDSATAFAAETATNKVITSRQDYVFLEMWHEAIEDKDVVYPRGNVQNQVPTYEGIAQSFVINGAPSGSVPGFAGAQGYAAFGEWDTGTNGRAMRWSTLTDVEKAIVLQDPENNIYSDGDKLIQVRYRVRVVEGLGDNWRSVSMTEGDSAIIYDTGGEHYVQVRGSDTVVADTGDSSVVNGLYVENTSSFKYLPTVLGQWGAGKSGGTPTPVAHEGLAFAIPIALVQRRNQGAYHPTYNPNGSNVFGDIGGGFGTFQWYSALAEKPNSTLECFTGKTLNSNGGTLSGVVRDKDDKAYDVIYASDVQDLRMSSRRRPLAEIREEHKRRAIAGEIRGFENVPFTTVTPITDGTLPSNSFFTVPTSISDITNVGDLVYIEEAGGYALRKVAVVSSGLLQMDAVAERTNGNLIVVISTGKDNHSQANPTWTDIIGDPVRILATFPDGVGGQWVGFIQAGGSQDYSLNRKSLDTSIQAINTVNDGVSWGVTNETVDTTLNQFTQNFGTNGVVLVPYETQAHFTEDDVNNEVLDLGTSTAFGYYTRDGGCILQSSLVDKVGISSSSGGLSEFNDIYNYSLHTGVLFNSVRKIPKHRAFALLDVNTVAVKTLDYLSVENGVAKLAYAYKEMVYDSTPLGWGDATATDTSVLVTYVTNGLYRFNNQSNYPNVLYRCSIGGDYTVDSELVLHPADNTIRNTSGVIIFEPFASSNWGDNNQFEIVDNQETLTDDNGNEVRHGTASFKTQYFIDDSN